ncbi:MAG: serine hydrolase [Verrucomicrobiaceae bacterium]|nr:serine hydrolase [Verrucomicrobiaceae bacterium]
MDRLLLLLCFISCVAVPCLTVAAIPTTGIAVPELAILDEEMEDLMTTNNIKAGSIALSRNGTIIFYRNYGWMNQAKTVPIREDVMMRIASCTKPLTAAGIRKLITAGQLSLTTKVFSLGTPGAGVLDHVPFRTADSRLSQITIQHLLQHRGGWDRDIAGDLTYMEKTIASEMGVTSPPSQDNTVRWIMGEPLQYDPGSTYAYSNIGYLLLGMIIEKISGQSCRDYVLDQVLSPLGVQSADYLMGRSFKVDQSPREPFYDEPTLGTNVFYPTHSPNPTVELPYGAFDMEARVGQGRVVTTPLTMVRYMGAYIISGNSIGLPRPAPGTWRANHSGSQRGASSISRARGDGINFAVFFNKRALSGTSYTTQILTTIDNIIDTGLITTWPTRDVTLIPELNVKDPANQEIQSGVGTVTLGQAPTDGFITRTFTLRNDGNGPLGNLATSITGSTDFTVNNSTPTSLGVGGNHGVEVKFQPTSTGAKSAVLTITSADDDEPTFTINLSATGTDQAGAFQVGAATIAVAESAGAVDIPITRMLGTFGSVSISATLTDGTAIRGEDYDLPTAAATFSDGQTQGTLSIPILLSTVAEPVETFTVTLTLLGPNGSIGPLATATVRILDATDAAKPTVTLTSPLTDAVFNDPAHVAVRGKATDNQGVSSVRIQLNQNAPVDADLNQRGDSASDFSVDLIVPAGQNSIKVESVDFNGNVSKSVVRAFHVTKPLSVSVVGPVGSGGVSKGFVPTSFRRVGVRHTITATPKAGFVFQGWTANDFTGTGVTDNTRLLKKLSFVMVPGLQLTANFVPNPFPPFAASYQGLLKPTLASTPSFQRSGFMSVTSTASGGFSGTLKVDGSSLPFSGSFDTTGVGRFGALLEPKKTFVRTGKPSVELAVQLDMLGQNQVTGTEVLKNGASLVSEAAFAAKRAGFHAGLLVPAVYTPSGVGTLAKGTYAVALPASPQTLALDGSTALLPASYAQGSGCGTLTLSAKGQVSLTGSLADGAALSASAPLNAALECPLFVSLYKSKGMFCSQAKFDHTLADSDVKQAECWWFKPPTNGAEHYPNGWPAGISTGLIGCLHTAPVGASVLPGLGATDADGNAEWIFQQSRLPADVSFQVNVSTTDKVAFIPVNPACAATITRSTGSLSGKFLHPDGSKPSFKGVILQKGASAGGHGWFMTVKPQVVTGSGESGKVLFQPH